MNNSITLYKMLVEEELLSNRFNINYQTEVKRGQKKFFDWAENNGKKEIALCTKKDLVHYHSWLCKQKHATNGTPLSPHTINGHFHSVCMLFSILYRNGLIKENPAHGLDLKLRENKEIKRRPLSREELNTLLEHVETDNEIGLRDRTIYELIYSSGLRVSEAANLKIKDIDLKNREIRVRGKQDRDRIVPISIVAEKFLTVYIGKRQDGESPVFLGLRAKAYGKALRGSQISRRFRELLRKENMDLPDISTHSIRHSTATHLLENGANIRQVQELLGHKDIENTVRYTQVETEGTAKMYRKYHPREHELFEVVDEEYIQKVKNL